MRCHTDPDVVAFAELVLAWLARDPVNNNVAYTVIDARINGYLPTEPEALWLRVVDPAGELAGVGVLTPPHPLLLSAMSQPVARVLAEHVARIMPDLASVNGPVDAADAFRVVFTASTGAPANAGRSSRVFHLDQVLPPSGVPGRARTATTTDRDLLVSWSAAFAAEASPDEPPGDPALPVDARLHGENLLWLWEVDGERVSTAWLTPPVAGVTRVSGVYTPPALRGRGYASACVAAVSRHALDYSDRCMLYTDLANPTSNKIYQQIGYRPAGDAQEWRFEPRPPSSI